MPATKRGIYHNLRESEYTVSNGEIVFFFSSKLYQDKFIEEYEINRLLFIERLNKVTDTKYLNMNTLADISHYIKTEKRGFHVWLKGTTINKEDLHLYALRKMTFQNTDVWRKIRKPKLKERLRIMV